MVCLHQMKDAAKETKTQSGLIPSRIGGLFPDFTLRYSGPDATAVTQLNGVAVDKRSLSEGQHTFQVYAGPVSAPQDVNVVVLVGGMASSAM